MIRKATLEDSRSLAELRFQLWPDGPLEEHQAELARFFAGASRQPLDVFVAVDGSGKLQGFCEVSIHPYAEGCRSEQVGYLEGWYVAPQSRRLGVGRALVGVAEDWARERGCSEFASDTEVMNRQSELAHKALGFSEASVIRCFRKDL